MYYKIPKSFFEQPQYSTLSPNAMVLYAMLLSKSELSIKNGWVDEKNKPYIYCTREQMARAMSVSERTAKRIFSELVKIGLVRVEKVYSDTSKRIYVENVLSRNYQHNPKETNSSLPPDDELRRILVEQFMQE